MDNKGLNQLVFA